MAFQTRDFASLIIAMTNRAKATQDKITDFRVGSVARTLMESPAAEIDELYQHMWIGLKEAIPTAIYQSFDFKASPSLPSSGGILVTISASSQDLTIPSGAIFKATSLPVSFVSKSNITIPAGQTSANIFVTATIAGSSTNIGAGINFSISPQPAGLISAVNQSEFLNGRDAEGDDERRVRFARFVSTLNRGTVSALRYGLSTSVVYDAIGTVAEYVKHSNIYEPFAHDESQPVGFVQCFVHNGSSGASDDLLEQTRNVINGYYKEDGTAVPGWKAAGVRVDVVAAESVLIAVNGEIQVLNGYDPETIKPLVSSAIGDYLSGLDIGESAIRAEIIASAMSIDGVYNFTLELPPADVTASYSQKLMVGTVLIA